MYFEELEMDGNPDRENIPFECLVPVEPQQDDQVCLQACNPKIIS